MGLAFDLRGQLGINYAHESGLSWSVLAEVAYSWNPQIRPLFAKSRTLVLSGGFSVRVLYGET